MSKHISEATFDAILSNKNLVLDVEPDAMYIYHNYNNRVFFIERCGCMKVSDQTVTEYYNLTSMVAPEDMTAGASAYMGNVLIPENDDISTIPF